MPFSSLVVADNLDLRRIGIDRGEFLPIVEAVAAALGDDGGTALAPDRFGGLRPEIHAFLDAQQRFPHGNGGRQGLVDRQRGGACGIRFRFGGERDRAPGFSQHQPSADGQTGIGSEAVHDQRLAIFRCYCGGFQAEAVDDESGMGGRPLVCVGGHRPTLGRLRPAAALQHRNLDVPGFDFKG